MAEKETTVVSPRAAPTRGLMRVFDMAGDPEAADAAPAMAQPAPPPAATTPDAKQKLVVTGAIEVSTDDVPGTADAIRAEARRRGATVVSDRQSGARYGVRAELQLRLLPDDVDPFIAWLATKGVIESTNVLANDVSRDYFDQQLRLRTLRVTLERLEKILTDRADTPLADVLAVEREMTRVRGEIEQLEGQHRYLADRVARATLDVRVVSHAEPVVVEPPKQKFILMARGLGLRFVDAGDRSRGRFGAGVALLFGRRFELGLDILPARGGDARSALFSLAGGFYSDFLGGGRRQFGNPYVGFRLGAGSVNDRSTLAYGAEVGVELARMKYVLVELAARVVGLYYNKDPHGSDITLQGTLGVGVPF